MPKRDGSIVFETKLDNKKLDKELNAVNAKIRKLKDNVENLKAQRMPLAEQMKAYGTRLDEARRKLEALKAEQARVNEILNPSNPANHVSYDEYIDAYMRKDSIDADVKRQQEEVDKLSKEWENAGKKVKDYDQKIKQATNNLNSATAQAGELSKKQAEAADGGKKLREETEKARKSMDKTAGTLGKVLKRIGGVAASAFIFSVAYRGFNALSKYLGSMITTNERFSKSLEVIKGNLLTAFQPIFEAVLPALEWLLDVVTDVTRGIAQFVAVLFGKDVKATAEAAKNQYEMAGAIEETGDAAKQAAKQLLPFDELNILETNASVDTSGVTEGAEEIGASFELIEDAETESWVDTLTNSNFGKGFVQFWEKMKDILSGTFGTIWDGVVSAFNWFVDIILNADPDLIETVLWGIVDALGIWISYKTITTAINGTKTALVNFGNALQTHPVLAAAGIIVGICSALGEFSAYFSAFNQEEENIQKLIGDIKQIGEEAENATSKTTNLLDTLELKTSDVETRYKGITDIADKFFDLSKKAILSENEKTQLEEYKTQLENYAPGIISKIDSVTGAWSGTKNELDEIITKQYELYLANAAEEVATDLFYQTFENQSTLEQLTQKAKELKAELDKLDDPAYKLEHFDLFNPTRLIEKRNEVAEALAEAYNQINELNSAQQQINTQVQNNHYLGSIFNSLLKGSIIQEDISQSGNKDFNTIIDEWFTNSSSSQKAEQTGKNIVNSLISGMDDSMQDFSNVGSNLANAIIKGFESGAISMRIPGLATGAVIPANREFVARLGDNKNEPEVVSPLSTMKQAFKEALAEMGGLNTGNYTAVLEVDGKELGRVLLPSLKKEQKRIGTSLVKG